MKNKKILPHILMIQIQILGILRKLSANQSKSFIDCI